ncbi:MAG: hypothetical protein ABI415_03125 [Flavitalea sp.]
MAISTNLFTRGLSGALKKQVVFRQVGKKTIVTGYPDMSFRRLSPKQLRIIEMMKDANIFIKGIIRDEQKRNEAQIRLDVPRNRLYNALIKEYFKNELNTTVTS